MPTPSPTASESRDEFIGRCMSDARMRSEYPDEAQRTAVCHQAWREKHGRREDYQRPSHRVERVDGDKVVIRDLELFAGFDPSIDSSNKRMEKYDAEGIRRVVERTAAFMSRGQFPRLILGHNPDEPDGQVRESLGRITDLRTDGTVITGDAEMSTADFEAYIRSNRFPRRSAEIWEDGYLSEVALLGSETPARPLPDTHFDRSGIGEVERFTRTANVETFQGFDDPGHGNTEIPKPKRPKMADKNNTNGNGDDDLRDKLKAAMDEIERLKAQLKAKNSGDGDKDKFARLETEREQFKRERDDFRRELDDMKGTLLREKYTRELEALAHQGYRIGDAEQFTKVLDRVCKADNPDAELEFFKGVWQRDPLNMRFPTQHARMADVGGPSEEKQEQARKTALARCEAEGKPDKFAMYYREALSA